jgi:hypothetical protein
MFRSAFIAATVTSVIACAASLTAAAADVVEVARSYPDGGGYEWQGTGVPHEIRFQGEQILAKGEQTYCSGYTFAVAMKAATERNLLRGKSPDAIRKFQKQWYGATEDSAETQCAYALRQLGIGEPVPPDEARPGDFLQLWRSNGSGHSVVFLDWITENERAVGVKYRSSQTATDGIGDRIEYFAGVAGKDGRVDAKRMYFGRLHERNDDN